MADTPLYIPYLRDSGLWFDYRAGIKGDSFKWAWERPTTDVQYLAIHHTVTTVRPDWVGIDGAKKYADEVATYHVDGRGWGGIGYHILCCPDGTVVYVGDVSTARANVANINEKVIGISMIGDFTKQLPSDKQITSMHELTKWFDGQRAVWPKLKSPWDAMVQGHKELNVMFSNPGTACPGSSWPVDMKDRIKNNIVYTPAPTPPPPPPQVPDDPEPTPVPPPTPPPQVPSPCCQQLGVEVEVLKSKVAVLEKQTIWDILRRK